MRYIKKLVSAWTTVAMTMSMIGGITNVANAETYTDVNEIHWAYSSIERCSAKSWFSGYPDGSFRPDGQITRAEAMKVFVTFLGEPLETQTQSTYYDVKPDQWYAPYIEVGKELFPKRTSLDGQLKFQPEMPVTREDVIYAIVVALGYTDETEFVDQSVLNMFSDQNSLSSNVRAYAAVAIANKFVEGHDDGTIGGQDPLTRAQFATLLARASEIGAKYTNNPIPRDVTISPEVMQTMSVGETITLSSIMTYSDDSTKDYSDQMNPYTDNTEGILAFNKNTITALKEGTAIVQFNNAHLADKNLVVIVKDNSGSPVINVSSYEHFTDKDSVTVSGKVSDATGSNITFTCNNKSLMINGDGSFVTTVNLKKGENAFEFKATNSHGKSAVKTIEIFKTEPIPSPTPVVTQPPTPTPVVTQKPTQTPVVTQKPTPTPTSTPTPTPKVTIPPTQTPTPTPKAKITPSPSPSPTPTPVVVVPPVITTEPKVTQNTFVEPVLEDDDISITAEVEQSGDTVTVIVSYDGASKITSAQFVLGIDSSKYTYSSGASLAYFGGAAAYQKSRGGVKYVYSNNSGINSSSGTFAKLVFKINEGTSFSKRDFTLGSVKIVSNSATYSGNDINTNIY